MEREQTIQLAKNLRKLIFTNHLTIVSVAQQVGMNKSTLHNYCHGVMPRNLLKIKKLADLFNVSLVELIFGMEVKSLAPSLANKVEGRFEVIIRPVDFTTRAETKR